MSGTALAPVDDPQNGAAILPPWIYPPADFENIDVSGYVALPAIAAQATIITFTVPQGRNGIIKKVANNFVGGGFTEGSGSIVYQILVDGAPPPGATTYENILGSLGNPANPVEIPGFRIYENQVITVVVNNVSILVAGQLAGARLIGYDYPREYEDQNIWI